MVKRLYEVRWKGVFENIAADIIKILQYNFHLFHCCKIIPRISIIFLVI